MCNHAVATDSGYTFCGTEWSIRWQVSSRVASLPIHILRGSSNEDDVFPSSLNSS
jgi:hypothetical protein